MKKLFLFLLALSGLTACSSLGEYEEPEYNYIADHVRVVDKTSNYVIYDYANIRIDEVAPIAAVYCHEQGGRQAALYDIGLRRDHRRRATFVCR